MRYSFILLVLMTQVSFAQKDYFSANNKNIQFFDTEEEERTARYALEQNDHLLLVQSIASATKTSTAINEIYTDAARLEQDMKRFRSQLKVQARLNRIAIASTLSMKRDEVYNKYFSQGTEGMDEQFQATVASQLKAIIDRANAYANEGSNVKIKEYSASLKSNLEEVLKLYEQEE